MANKEANDQEQLLPDSSSACFAGMFLNGHLQQDIFTDCRVECQGEVFHAHRNVLGTASPVLRAALTTEGMKEANSSCVVIDDFAPKVARLFLTALYYPSSVDGIQDMT